MKTYKKHVMYNEKGEGFMANSHEQHLSMKKKGLTRTKPSTKKKAKKIIRKRSGY